MRGKRHDLQRLVRVSVRTKVWFAFGEEAQVRDISMKLRLGTTQGYIGF